MAYIKLSTMEFPVYEGIIRLEHKDIPENLTGDTFPCPDGYAKVQDMTPPLVAEGFKPVFTHVALVGENWVMCWDIQPLTDKDKKYAALAADTEENKQIRFAKSTAQTMRTMLPLADKDKWDRYYDALVTYENSYPRSGQMPTKPV